MFPPAPSPYLQSLPELLSAKRKLAEVASYFDASKLTFKSFDTRKLDALQFKNRLWQIFYVALTDAELGAVITLFDHDGSHTIDLLEFIRSFFKFGDVQKKSFVSSSLEHRELLNKSIQKKVLERQERIAPIKEIEYTESWTQEDDERVMQKMTMAAFVFDQRLCAVELQDFFRVDSFSPAEFKEKVKRSFNIKLTNNELFALVNRFSGRFHGRVDAKLFFDNFFRQRREVQSVEFAKHEKIYKWKDDQIKRLVKNFVERFGKERIAKVSPATEADLEAACIKLKHAAAHTKPLLFGTIRDFFEGSHLTRTQFRDFLSQVYDVDLTLSELDATMKIFDMDLDGTISYVEFTSTFYALGQGERSKITLQQKSVEQKRAQKKKEVIQQRHEKFLKSIEPKIKWPIVPDEDDDYDYLDADGATGEEDDENYPPSEGEEGVGKVEQGSVGGGGRTNKAKKQQSSSKFLPPLSSSSGLDSMSLAQSLSNASSETMLRTRSVTAMDRTTGIARKAATEEFIKPNPLLQRLVATKASFAVLFPKISQDTKDFLRDLEGQERDIRKMNKKNTSTSTNRSSTDNSKASKRAGKLKKRRSKRRSNKGGAYGDYEQQEDGDEDEIAAGAGGGGGSSFGASWGIGPDVTGMMMARAAGRGGFGGGDGEEGVAGEAENYEGFHGGEEGGEEEDPNNVEYEMELDDHWKFDPIFESTAAPSDNEQQRGEPSPSSVVYAGGGAGKVLLRSPLASPSGSSHATQRLSASAGGGGSSTGGGRGTRMDSGTMRPDSRSDSRGQLARPDSRSDSRGGVSSAQDHRLGSSGLLPQNASGLSGFRAPRREQSSSSSSSNVLIPSSGSGVGIVALVEASSGAGDDDYGVDDYEEEYEEDEEEDAKKEGPPIIIS